MKKLNRAIALLLILCVIPVIGVSAHPFEDVASGSWYDSYVEYVYANGLMNGTSGSTFGPDENMSRAMVVTVLYRMAGSPAVTTVAPFTDVPADQYYAAPVNWAYLTQVVNGTSDTTFSPSLDVTREQLVTIIFRYAASNGYDTSARADLSGYADMAQIDGYAVDAFQWAVSCGIISGTSATTLDPNGNATRAQCAAILQRVNEKFRSPASANPELTVIVRDKTMSIGETYQIEYTYTGDKSNLTWKSRNTSVATVDANGLVTTLAEGKAKIMVSDGNQTGMCTVIVDKSVVRVTELVVVSTDGLLYDGVTRYAGDYLWMKVSNRPWEATRDITVTSSNPAVVSVSKYNDDYGNVQITLNFNSAGSSVITLTSGDGVVSKSYTISVASGYSFDPGDGQLSPEEFASYATKVMCANGFTEKDNLGSWRLMTLTAEELTFDRAISTGQARVHEWWPNGVRSCQIVYIGQNEDGNYQFHTCWGD